jgi:hypothetical protein
MERKPSPFSWWVKNARVFLAFFSYPYTMNTIMKKFLIFILIHAIGLFQFMPIMHAEENISWIHCDDWSEHTHDMSDCIDIVQDVLDQRSYSILEITGYTSPLSYFEKFIEHRSKILLKKWLKNWPAPPYFHGHNLVWIVKLTT